MQTGALMLTIRRKKQIFMCQVASRSLVSSGGTVLSLACHVTLLLSYQLYWLYFYLQCRDVAPECCPAAHTSRFTLESGPSLLRLCVTLPVIA